MIMAPIYDIGPPAYLVNSMPKQMSTPCYSCSVGLPTTIVAIAMGDTLQIR